MADDIKLIIKAILDDKDFKKGMKEIAKGTGKANDKLKKQGGILSKLKVGYLAIASVIGGAVVAGLTKMVKVALDAQETISKFETVFKDVADQADKTAKTMAKSFGISSVSAKKLLGDTGDLLTGFGFTGESALEMSKQVNELAIDLASFTNFSGGAEGASQALTKALLGERESIKSLGIAITETDIKNRALAEGMDAKNITRQQKAMLTLKIAMDQSKNAIGDFARTNKQGANLIRIFRERVLDIAITLGSKFLPILEKTLPAINDWLENVNTAFKDIPGNVKAFVGETESALSDFLKAPVETIKNAVVENQDEIKKFGLNVLVAVGKLGIDILKVFSSFMEKVVIVSGFAFNKVIEGLNLIPGVAIPTLNNLAEVARGTFDGWLDSAETALDGIVGKVEESNEAITESNAEASEARIEQQALTNDEIAMINKELQEVNKAIREEDTEAEIEHLNNLITTLQQHGLQVVGEWSKVQKQIGKIQDLIIKKEWESRGKRIDYLKQVGASFSSITDSMMEIETNRLKEMEKENSGATKADIKRQKDKLRTIARWQRNTAIFNAVTDSASAVVKTMASVPFPLNVPLATAQGIAGAMQVSAIKSQPMPEFALGSDELPRDTVAKIHAGERIIPADMNIRGMSNEALMASAIRGLSIPAQSGSVITNNNQAESVVQNVENVFNVPEETVGIEEMLDFAERTNSMILKR